MRIRPRYLAEALALSHLGRRRKESMCVRFVFWTFFSLGAFAQSNGAITGKVSDTFGEAVAGASIQARNAATGAVYKATSQATGEYRLEGLPGGAYDLSVTMIRITTIQPARHCGSSRASVERYRRPDLGHLELEMTVEDPGALKKPWIVKRVAILDPTDEIMENICSENEKDLKHVPGK